MTNLTKENFDEIVAEGITLVDFWAEWCAPCRLLSPAIEALAEKYEGQYKVCKVNVDEEEGLAVRYGVMTIPTVFLFRNGEELDKRVGVYPMEEFETMLKAAEAGKENSLHK